MRRIIYFHRHPDAGISIEKATSPVIDMMENKEVFNVPCARANPLAMARNLLYVMRRRSRGDIHHVTGDIHYAVAALTGRKTVLTVHDTVTVDFDNGYGRLKKRIFEWLWFRIPLRMADKVVCISESTKKSLQRFTDRTDITVIHNAVGNDIEFRPKTYDGSRLKVLIVGTNPNKNIERQFEALSGVDCFLTVIGNLSDAQKQMLRELNIEYIEKTGLSDAEVDQEYYDADVLLFCSLFEGFGMPVIEANKAGTPVICSDLPVLREVAGEAALFVNPLDAGAIRNAVKELAADIALRKSLTERGAENAKRFSVDKIAGQWRSLYESL